MNFSDLLQRPDFVKEKLKKNFEKKFDRKFLPMKDGKQSQVNSSANHEWTLKYPIHFITREGKHESFSTHLLITTVDPPASNFRFK